MSKTYDLKKVFTISLLISLLFVAAIYFLAPNLERFNSTLLPDTGFAWYYWKLPQPETMATITMWLGYGLHQILVWYLAFRLRSQPRPPKGRIGRVNLQLLIVNAVFIAVHLIQSQLWYDGLAQYVPVISSQGSVIIMLVLMLVMLNARRGMFFGKKAPLPARGTALATKLHPLFIAWATVYTFWFHPMEGTAGHLHGFFYMFMLLTQLSLARTEIHLNIKWITILEVYVAFHGAIVAIDAGNGMWPMFFFGFMMMFIVTQIHGIIKNRTALLGVFASYTALVLVTYSGALGEAFSGTPVGWGDIHQITWIPVILYGLALTLPWVLEGVARLKGEK